jgi:hypothetical protein
MFQTGHADFRISSRKLRLRRKESLMPGRTVVFAGAVMLLSIQPATAHADYSVTDLVDAAQRGDSHAVHKLIDAGAALDARGPMGYTALHWSGVRGDWRIFTELVAAGAPVNAVGSDGGTPLHWACHHDRPDAVRLLLDAGADISVSNRWGRTPLHVAARRNCRAVAELLLDSGADPNVTTNEGWTPLHVAALSGHLQMLDLLEDRGGDFTRKDFKGRTPRQCLRRPPHSIEIDHALLDDYVGIYDLGGGITIKVWLEEAGLRLREFAPDDLFPVGLDEFACRQEPWRVRFSRDTRGNVSTVEVEFLRRTVRGEKVDVPRYVGARVCTQCHTGADHERQDVVWMRSAHAHAYWDLGTDWAMYLAKLRPHYHDLENAMEDERCTLCHVTGSQEPDALFDASFRPQEGVTCEACHGPGSNYATTDVMADPEAFAAAGGRIPDEATCRGCHRNSETFEWEEMWPKVAHPVPTAAANSERLREGSSGS